MAKKGRGSSLNGKGLEMYGVSDLLKKIESAGGNVENAVKKAVDESLKIIGDDMQKFMAGHKQTGDTMESYEQVPAKVGKGGLIEAEVGYNAKQGGLPAIFLDVGTPKMKPYFYRYYAVENNRKRIEDIQQQALNDILKELTQ